MCIASKEFLFPFKKHSFSLIVGNESIFPYSMAEDQPNNDAISHIMQIDTIRKQNQASNNNKH